MKNTNVIPIQKIPSMLENDYQFVDLRDPYEYKKIHLTKFKYSLWKVQSQSVSFF